MAIQPLTTQHSIIDMILRRPWRDGLESTGEVANIGGFNINLSGQLASTSQTVKVDKTPPANFVLKTDNLSPQLNAMLQEAGDEPLATMPDEVTLIHTPHMPEPVAGMGFLPEGVFGSGNEVGYQKQQVARVMELAEIEKGLQSQYGSDVKLAFDPGSGNYVMLKPGDIGYDAVASAQSMKQKEISYLMSTGYNRQTFADVLKQYGIG